MRSGSTRCSWARSSQGLLRCRCTTGSCSTALRSGRNSCRRALGTRAVIDQAIGIIRARSGVGPQVAFDRLVRMSQAENTKLHIVAERLVDEAVRRAMARQRD